MTSWTAHLRYGREPVLVREGWSWGAALFGPFWLLAQRAWIPAVFALLALVLNAVLVPAALKPIVALGLAVALGTMGRDLVRWSLERRGYVLGHVLAARDAEGALSRLLTAQPEIAAQMVERLR